MGSQMTKEVKGDICCKQFELQLLRPINCTKHELQTADIKFDTRLAVDRVKP